MTPQKNRSDSSATSTDLEEDDLGSRWGWFGFTPDCLQRFNTGYSWGIAIVLTNMATTFVITGLLGLVVTSLERRFTFTPGHIAWISNAAEFSPVVVYILIIVFARESHRPRICAASTVVLAVGSLLFALPHFTTNTYLPTEEIVDGNVCTNSTDISCEQGGDLQDYVWVFILARVLIGGGSACTNTIATTYLDDNTHNEDFGFLMGLGLSATLVGPAIAFVMGGFFLTLYTDFYNVSDGELTFNQTDPRWVGAWWLPFLIGAGFLFLCVPYLAGFPKNMPGSKAIRRSKRNEAFKSKRTNSSGSLITSLKTVCRNPVFLLLCFFMFSNSFIMSGFVTFGAKFVENQFGQTATTAGLMWGLTVMVGGFSGAVLAGVLVKRLKLTAFEMTRILVIISIINTVVIISALLHCDAVSFAGVNADYWNSTIRYEDSDTLYAECNSGCVCDDIPFDPICGIDNLRYYSPCYAGCTDYVIVGLEKEYYNCSCITNPDPSTPSAFMGDCEVSNCGALYIFIVLFLVSAACLLASAAMTQTVIVRAVQPKDQIVALTTYWSGLRLLGNTPGTVAIGAVFASNCLHSEDKCGVTGACLALDVGRTALELTLVLIAIKVVSQIFITLAYLVYRKSFKDDIPVIPEHEIYVSAIDGGDEEPKAQKESSNSNRNETGY